MKKKDASYTGKTICFDFDGVIHSYVSGWQGADVILDPMVTGIGKLIRKLKMDGYQIVIFTTRAIASEGYEAVQKYLNRRHIPYDLITSEKHPAFCYVDDRGICFDGNVDGLYEKIVNFKSWTDK